MCFKYECELTYAWLSTQVAKWPNNSKFKNINANEFHTVEQNSCSTFGPILNIFGMATTHFIVFLDSLSTQDTLVNI